MGDILIAVNPFKDLPVYGKPVSIKNTVKNVPRNIVNVESKNFVVVRIFYNGDNCVFELYLSSSNCINFILRSLLSTMKP